MEINEQNKISTSSKIKENHQYKVSIIVPCYNTKPWLDKCLQSLVDQTLQNIEIICVNDGSTDGTGERLDEWQTNYPTKIKVIYQANGGLSNARNAGMKIAQGEYIGFVDSDDFVDVCMYEKLYKAVVDNNADIVRCNYLHFTDNISTIKDNCNQIIKENLLDELMKSSAIWAAIYKNIFLQEYKINFIPNLLYEDIAFQYEISMYKPITYKITEQLYFYRQDRLNQITSFTDIRCFDILRIFSCLHNKLSENDNYHLIYKLCLRRHISLSVMYLLRIKKQYKIKFLFNSANELFSNHKISIIYKNILTSKYRKSYSNVIALIFTIILHLCYIFIKINFYKSKVF